MRFQDLGEAHFLIAEKTIGSFASGPVPTGLGNVRQRLLRKLLGYPHQPPIETLVSQVYLGQLVPTPGAFEKRLMNPSVRSVFEMPMNMHPAKEYKSLACTRQKLPLFKENSHRRCG